MVRFPLAELLGVQQGRMLIPEAVQSALEGSAILRWKGSYLSAEQTLFLGQQTLWRREIFQCPVWASRGVWGIGKKEAMWEKKRDGEEKEERKKGERELQLLNTHSVAITYFYGKFKVISHCFMFILMANTYVVLTIHQTPQQTLHFY